MTNFNVMQKLLMKTEKLWDWEDIRSKVSSALNLKSISLRHPRSQLQQVTINQSIN